MDKWDGCAFPVREDDLEGRVCYGGLDLSSTTDITAFVLVFPPLDEDDKYMILPYFWIPEDTLELRVRRDHVPYDVWERQGFLQTTEGNVVHYGYVEKCENGTVYTVEGNSGDACKQQSYPVGSGSIYGYGCPNY